MMETVEIELPDEQMALNVAAGFAAFSPDTAIVYLKGDLGTGKTTFSRGFIQSLGHTGNVKSPTYTLIDSYELPDKTVQHMDLYRLTDPEELEYLGIDDVTDKGISLIEWPERGQGVIPEADLVIRLEYLDTGRIMRVEAHTPVADRWLKRVISHLE